MASIPSNENPELESGQEPIGRGNINREVYGDELVDYGNSSDEEEPAVPVARKPVAADDLVPTSGQEVERPAWAKDFMQEMQSALLTSTQKMNAFLEDNRLPLGIPRGISSNRRLAYLSARGGSPFAPLSPEENRLLERERAQYPLLRRDAADNPSRRVEVSEAGPSELPQDGPSQRPRPRVPSRVVRLSHSPPPPEVRVPARIVRVTPPNEVNPSQSEDDEDNPGALHPNDEEGDDPPLASQATHQRGSRSSNETHWKLERPEKLSGDSKQDINTWLGIINLYAHNAHVPDGKRLRWRQVTSLVMLLEPFPMHAMLPIRAALPIGIPFVMCCALTLVRSLRVTKLEMH